MGDIRRREFVTTLLGSATAWPLLAHAQQGARVRRVGTRSGVCAKPPRPWMTEGRNIHLEYRAAAGDIDRFRSYAAELINQAPDLILVQSNPGLAALQQATRSIPIVFVQVADPVGSGFIASLARPGGNTTGFTNFEPSMGSKWLELLREISPQVTHGLVLMHPETVANVSMSRAAEAAAMATGIKLVVAGVHDAAEIESAIAKFEGGPNGGLIIIPHTVTVVNQRLIVELAARNRLPTVFAFRYSVVAGALMSYGVDADDLYRRAATYVDRILKGAKPSDLPVQAPTKFELAINLKTAKALGLDVPPTLVARADEVIE
jgi:putative tryptophan/tyrosine transport system substrate-binding protein